MGKAPAFQFYAADFLVGVAEFTLDEIGLYIKLLALSWDKGPLPLSSMRLAAMSGLSEKAFLKLWLTVGEKWTPTERGYINERLEFQRLERESFAAKQAENGKRGGRPRKAKLNPNESGGFPLGYENGNPNHNPKKALQSSVFDLRSSTPLHRERVEGGELPPAWNTRTPQTANHLKCYQSAACGRGICVPGWLGAEWQQQYGDDVKSATEEIAQVIAAALTALPPTGPVGDVPKEFWRAVWKDAHGSHAPESGRKSKGHLTLDAARRVVIRRIKAIQEAS